MNLDYRIGALYKLQANCSHNRPDGCYKCPYLDRSYDLCNLFMHVVEVLEKIKRDDNLRKEIEKDE